MIIISSSTKKSSLQKSGGFYAAHTFIDIINKEHKISDVFYSSEKTSDELILIRNNLANVVSEYIINSEFKNYLDELKRGVNPFRNRNDLPVSPEYTALRKMLKRVLDFVGDLDSAAVKQYRLAIPFLANLDQSTVESLGYIWADYQNWVTSIANTDAADVEFKKLVEK